jgi:hypothetical protein
MLLIKTHSFWHCTEQFADTNRIEMPLSFPSDTTVPEGDALAWRGGGRVIDLKERSDSFVSYWRELG